MCECLQAGTCTDSVQMGLKPRPFALLYTKFPLRMCLLTDFFWDIQQILVLHIISTQPKIGQDINRKQVPYFQKKVTPPLPLKSLRCRGAFLLVEIVKVHRNALTHRRLHFVMTSKKTSLKQQKLGSEFYFQLMAIRK